LKPGIRIAAFASGPIGKRGSTGKTIVVGVIWRDNIMEGLLSGKVEIDGSDSTKLITSLLSKSRFSDQVKLIALNGVALAGLNVVDINAIQKKLKTTTIIVTRNRQRAKELINAIELHASAKTRKEKINLVKEQATIRLRSSEGFYFRSQAKSMPKYLVIESAAALRAAHIIASGIAMGESKGRI
jgi:endonuclease V-like protein UPF0215 family